MPAAERDAQPNLRLASALNHPIRARILAHLRDNDEASPGQLAKAWGIDVGVVSYHVRKLASLRFVYLVRRVQRRGAIEHRYALRVAVLGEMPALDLILGESEPTRITAADIGDAVRRLRRSRGMSPKRLAAEAGIPADMLRAIESGDETAQIGTLIALADCLRSSLRQLTG